MGDIGYTGAAPGRPKIQDPYFAFQTAQRGRIVSNPSFNPDFRRFLAYQIICVALTAGKCYQKNINAQTVLHIGFIGIAAESIHNINVYCDYNMFVRAIQKVSMKRSAFLCKNTCYEAQMWVGLVKFINIFKKNSPTPCRFLQELGLNSYEPACRLFNEFSKPVENAIYRTSSLRFSRLVGC